MQSRYKGVSKTKGGWLMSARFDGLNMVGKYPTEHEAARAYDLACIRKGIEPINVLKRK